MFNCCFHLVLRQFVAPLLTIFPIHLSEVHHFLLIEINSPLTYWGLLFMLF